jgi:ribosomal protein S18 acetylase RimI-like enzyme
MPTNLTTAPTPATRHRVSDLVPRLATPEDLPSIGAVIDSAYAVYADRMERPPAPVLTDYRPAVEHGNVWVIGEPLAGLIVLEDDREAGSLLVENIAVHPSAQGRGLGRLLMQFAEQQAAAGPFSRLTLYTNEVMTENLAIYARLGYREVSRGTQDGYRRVFMEKLLH